MPKPVEGGRLSTGNERRLRPKEIKFLEAFAQTGDHAAAYMAAGYKASTRESARVASYNLLRRLESSADYRDTLRDVGISDYNLAKAIKALMDHPDPRVAAQGVAIAAKVKGWMAERVEAPRGVQILIVQQNRAVAEADESPLTKVQVKPVSIIR